MNIISIEHIYIAKYFILLISLYFISLFYLDQNKKISINVILFFTLYIAFYFGFKPISIGSDTTMYMETNLSVSIYNLFSQTGREPLYYLFVSMVNLLTGNNPYAVFLFISIAVGLVFLYLMKDQVNRLFLPIMLIYIWGHFLFITYNINIMRQAFASVFVLLLFNDMMKSDKFKIKHLILMLAATQSHSSAYCVIMFYLVYIFFKRLEYKKIGLFYLISLILFIFIIDINNILPSILLPFMKYLNIPEAMHYRLNQYFTFSNSIKFSYGLILSSIIFILHLSLGDLLNKSRNKLIFIGNCTYLSLFMIFANNEVFFRMTLYVWIFEFLAIGNILEYYSMRFRPIYYIVVLFIPISICKTYYILTSSGFFYDI